MKLYFLSTVGCYRALVLERLGIQLHTGKNMSFQNGHPIYLSGFNFFQYEIYQENRYIDHPE